MEISLVQLRRILLAPDCNLSSELSNTREDGLIKFIFPERSQLKLCLVHVLRNLLFSLKVSVGVVKIYDVQFTIVSRRGDWSGFHNNSFETQSVVRAGMVRWDSHIASTVTKHCRDWNLLLFQSRRTKPSPLNL